ncbi:MAG: hypothetical protein JWP76_5050 [Dactylosporangium sp.]|jgi:hypothetical protein|nr:hypothetical protein [Dactylosporangium sp.]
MRVVESGTVGWQARISRSRPARDGTLSQPPQR